MELNDLQKAAELTNCVVKHLWQIQDYDVMLKSNTQIRKLDMDAIMLKSTLDALPTFSPYKKCQQKK